MPLTAKLVSVRCFEVLNHHGESMGLFKVESEWQGMKCLVSVDGVQRIIVDASEDYVSGVLGNIFGEHRLEASVVKASPDMVAKLRGDGAS